MIGALGRPTQTIFGDAGVLGMAYDPDNNVTGVTMPSDAGHSFAYTPVDQLQMYTPPYVDAGASVTTLATTYGHDVDRMPTGVVRPDGNNLGYDYDTLFRLKDTTTTTPPGSLTPSYDPSDLGRVKTLVAAPSGETTTYNYDGFLRTGTTWTGTVAGSVVPGFDNNFRMTSLSVNGSSLSFGYDDDGILTTAGALTLTPDSPPGTLNGLLNGTTLGSVTDTYGYDANGLLQSYTAKYSGSVIYSETINARYPDGRIQQRTEVVQGTSHVWIYAYDRNGRLTDVTKDGSAVGHYGYDVDDNRTTFTGPSGPTIHPTYDAQDRLTTYGTTTYGYTASGDLATKTTGTQVTTYTYDAFGNLLHVGGLPVGPIDYIVDGENRRVGKKVNGNLVEGFLYQDALHTVAQLDGSGNVVARFVFGSKPNVPDYYVTSAGTFRILSDHLGSPRLVVNTSTGVVDQIDYDEFGNATDAHPGTIPFGFAGGLYDQDTGLVRFGARDYDASVGRWASKDPIRFDGGNNLYVYTENDPIDTRDPAGKSVLCILVAGFWSDLCRVWGGSEEECQRQFEKSYQWCIDDREKNYNCKLACEMQFCDPGALQACYRNCDDQHPFGNR